MSRSAQSIDGRPLVVPAVDPAGERAASPDVTHEISLRIPAPTLSLPPTAEPVRTATELITAVNDANRVRARIGQHLTTPDGIARLAESFSGTSSTNPAFHGINGVQLFQEHATTLETITELVNSGNFRTDSSSLSAHGSALVSLTNELTRRVA